MAFTAAEVMQRAADTLQDANGVRWPATELHGYLNDGLREIATLKPNAKTETVNLLLAAGTKQDLPDQYTVLSRVSRNMTDATTGGGAIRTLDSRSILDSFLPGWQDESAIPFAAKVVHVIHDIADPKTFYVAPGNDGSGIIEAVVGVLPDDVATPASPNSIAAYSTAVDIDDVYMNALTDYVLYRSYSKDARVAGSAVRSAAHFEAFRSSVTVFSKAETGAALSTHAASVQQAREQ